MTIDEILNIGEKEVKVPAYLLKYENFYKFIKSIVGYVKATYTNKLEELAPYLSPQTAEGVIQDIIADKSGVTIQSWMTEDIKRIFLTGASIRFTSKGYREQLAQTIIDMSYNRTTGDKMIEKVVIIDKGITTTNKDSMNITISMIGRFDTSTSQLLNSIIYAIRTWLVPQITGVNVEIKYTPYGTNLFAFDYNEPYDDSDPDNISYGKLGWDEGSWQLK